MIFYSVSFATPERVDFHYFGWCIITIVIIRKKFSNRNVIRELFVLSDYLSGATLFAQSGVSASKLFTRIALI